MGKFIDFIHAIGNLKRIRRTGWVVQGVKEPESVADHSYRVAVLAMLLAHNHHLDETKLLKMALIHDLAEGIVGDIVLEKGNKVITSKSTKFEAEKAAMQKIFSHLAEGDYYYNLWLEYEEQSSPESKLLKQIDKIEMVAQALEYEEGNDPEKLNEFWINTEKYLHDKEIIDLFNKLKAQRKLK